MPFAATRRCNAGCHHTTPFRIVEHNDGHDQCREREFHIDRPLFIHGDADRILPAAATARRQAKMIKHARFAEIPGGPHGLCWTHGDRVNAELLPFVE